MSAFSLKPDQACTGNMFANPFVLLTFKILATCQDFGRRAQMLRTARKVGSFTTENTEFCRV